MAVWRTFGPPYIYHVWTMTKSPLYDYPFYNIAKKFHNNPFLTFSSLSHVLCRSRPGPNFKALSLIWPHFKKCKNVNGRFNENTLKTAVKMCWNIVIAFVRLILIIIVLKQLRGDMSLTLKNRNLESECVQKIYGDKADQLYVYGVWLMDQFVFQRCTIIRSTIFHDRFPIQQKTKHCHPT